MKKRKVVRSKHKMIRGNQNTINFTHSCKKIKKCSYVFFVQKKNHNQNAFKHLKVKYTNCLNKHTYKHSIPIDIN